MYKKVSKAIVVTFLTLISSSIFATQLVDINKADAVTIAENLNGIGNAKAKAIVEYRLLNGDFSNEDDLIKVKGVGSKLVERNRDLISFTKSLVSSGSAPSPTGNKADGKAAVVPMITGDASAPVVKAAGN